MEGLEGELLLAQGAALGDLYGFADALEAEDVPARGCRDGLHGSQAYRALQVRQPSVILLLSTTAATTALSFVFVFAFVFVRTRGRG